MPPPYCILFNDAMSPFKDAAVIIPGTPGTGDGGLMSLIADLACVKCSCLMWAPAATVVNDAAPSPLYVRNELMAAVNAFHSAAVNLI